jgi:hypothetical protein
MRINRKVALTSLFFPESTKDNLETEFAQVDVLEGSYGMAPFAMIGQKAFMVDQLNGRSYTLQTPFINIGRPLKWSTDFVKRQAGMGVFVNSDTNAARARAAMEKDVDYMNALIDNRIEWMVAMIIRGQIDYDAEGHDSFIINSGKPSANTLLAAILWDNGSANPFEDFFQAKKVIAARSGPAPNIAICGATAGAALRAMVTSEGIKILKTTSGVDTGGSMSMRQVIEDSGMVFLGRLSEIDIYEYTGTFQPDDGGSDEPFIRDNFVEFFSTSDRSVSERQLLFGSMPDLLIIQAGEHVTERHLTTVPPKPDQGTLQGIMKSRPFPHLRRPDWQVSLQVLT